MLLFEQCFFFITGEEETEAGGACNPYSWLGKITFTSASENVYTQYVSSLYWAAATALSVGYGDITPQTLTELGLCVLLMVGGVVFFGYIIASIAASLANADSQRASYMQKIVAMKQYLKVCNVCICKVVQQCTDQF